MTCCPPRLVLGTTESVCPVCLRTLPATREAEGDTVFLCRTCPDHGEFRVPVWRGLASWIGWGRGAHPQSRPRVTATAVDKG
jgi:7,8-dihydro-6-hydroxymethylpterin dimethyltransferase